MAGNKLARVYHAELWGTREHKYRVLWDSDVEATEWAEVEAAEPRYFFTPRGAAGAAYRAAPAMTDIFRQTGQGIESQRDAVAVRFTRQEVEDTVSVFLHDEEEDIRQKLGLHRDGRDWTVSTAKGDVAAGGTFQRLLYRPFDQRWTWYSGRSKGFIAYPRDDLNCHIVGHRNRALLCMRQSRRGEPNAAFVSQLPVGKDVVSSLDRVTVLPLYLYSQAPVAGELGLHSSDSRRANLSPEFIADFSSRLGLKWTPDGTGDRTATFGPEDVFHYIYAILHSPAYRERYAEFLKIDFPRIPLTTNAEFFRGLCAHGAELVGLHLMERTLPRITRFDVAGDNKVEKVRYTEPGEGADEGRVWINSTQYFDGVAPEVWTFRIGGYQVADKWLKDRKGRALTYEDLDHYQRTLAALKRTSEVMEEIDATIERHCGWPIAAETTEVRS